MKKMILAALVFAAFLPGSAHALEFLKCNTMEGKTIYGTFGKVTFSGDPKPHFFPIEIVIFASRTALQDRIFYSNYTDGMKVPVESSPAAFTMSFPAKGPDGQTQTETLTLRLYASFDLTAFQGVWTSSREQQETKQQAYCSIF